MNHLGDSEQSIKREFAGERRSAEGRRAVGGEGAECRGRRCKEATRTTAIGAWASVGRSARLKAGSTAGSGAKSERMLASRDAEQGEGEGEVLKTGREVEGRCAASQRFCFDIPLTAHVSSTGRGLESFGPRACYLSVCMCLIIYGRGAVLSLSQGCFCLIH